MNQTKNIAFPGDAGRSWNTRREVLRCRGRVQCDGDGAAGPEPRGPLQLLQQKADPEDGAAAG